MIKIGVSSCFMYPDLNRKVFGPKTLLYMGYDMVHYVARRGVMPILIPDLVDDKLFYKYLDEMDGFLFQGGMDIDPVFYGQDPLNEECKGDHRRDAYELKIMDYAFERGKPILAICRGMQLLNVYFNGTLHQDIETQIPKASLHRDHKLYDELTHKIEFTRGGVLEKIHVNDSVYIVNSVHHQAINKLGDNLMIEAICPDDNIIEAITWTGPDGGDQSFEDGLVVGLQWHPEFFHTMDANTLNPNPMMDHFIKKCREKSLK